MNFLQVSFLIGFAFVLSANAATDKIICYYGSWGNYAQGDAEAKIEHLDHSLCTHLIYTFVGISTDGNIHILDQWVDIDLKALKRVNELKNRNRDLKVLLAIGGWNEGSPNYSTVAGNPSLRKTFAKNVVKFLQQYGFDGFDLDWEYPAQRGGSPADKQNFIELIKDLRSEFDKNNLLLTAAVGASKHHRVASYNVPEMSKNLDFINVMAYDLHIYEEGYAGFNAPLFESPLDKKPELNVNDIVEGWIKDGADPQKLVLGLGFYGKSYTLADASNNNPGAPTVGAGNPGPHTNVGGILSYLEICKKIKNEGWTAAWDEKQQVPYAYHGNQWVGYDDTKSLDLKVELAKKKNLAGVMMWSIQQDDIRNKCGEGNFPLLTALNKSIGRKAGSSTFVAPTTRAPVTTQDQDQLIQTQKSVQAPSSDSSTLTSSGDCVNSFAVDTTNCQNFYRCLSDGTKILMSCPPGTLFDKSLVTCGHAGLVNCG